MKTQRGTSLLKTLEALRLKAYLDGAGVPTIGWGHTKGVSMGDTCTLEQAQAWFDQETAEFQAGVSKLAPVATDLQLDALTIFAYNAGLHGFATSTALRLHNAKNYAGVPAAFGLYNKITVNGVKVLSPGLVNRQRATGELYTAGCN